MSKHHAAVAASVQHVRRAAHRALAGAAPHTRKSSLTLPVGTLVVDTVTGQHGVIIHGKKTHVPTQSPRG